MDDVWLVSNSRKDVGSWADPLRSQALKTATVAIYQAISFVGETLQNLGYDSEPPNFEFGSPYDHYCERD